MGVVMMEACKQGKARWAEEHIIKDIPKKNEPEITDPRTSEIKENTDMYNVINIPLIIMKCSVCEEFSSIADVKENQICRFCSDFTVEYEEVTDEEADEETMSPPLLALDWTRAFANFPHVQK